MRLVGSINNNLVNHFLVKIRNWFGISMLLVALTACGPGVNNPAPTTQEIAIEKIANYAQNGGAKPSLQDYIDAGVSGIDATNLAEINTAVEQLNHDDVDTEAEIQAIADSLGVVLLDAPLLIDAPAQSYTKDTAITVLIFTNNGGGTLTSCTADILPIGLSVAVSADTSSCEITGIPTVEQTATTHTITATNATGSDTATVSMKVKVDVPPLALPALENAAAQSYVKGSPITTLIFINNGGGELSGCTVDTLPTGLSVAVSADTSSCEVTGTPTVEQTATIHTITASNATGSNTATVSIEVTVISANMVELVKDLDPISTVSSYPKRLTKVGNTLYFLTNSPGNNITKLWKSNGTEATTVLLKTFSTSLTAHTRLVSVGNTLFFNIDDGIHGLELWKSDGTSATTLLVKDIETGIGGSVTELTALGNMIFFAGFTSDSGTELWKSDGTSIGTQLVKNINADFQGQLTKSSDPRYLTVMGDTLYFAAFDDSIGSSGNRKGRDIWKSNGTEATTVLLKDLYGTQNSSGSDINNLTVVGSTLFFSAPYVTTSKNYGNELWKTDGTTSGTVVVKNINTTPISAYEDGAAFRFNVKSYFTAVADTLYFVAFNGAPSNGGNGWELWKSDGTTNGTALVKDIVVPASSFPEDLVSMGNMLYFVAPTDTYGLELWKSDGTEIGTTLIKDTLPGNGDGFYRGLSFLTVVGNKFYFSANGFLWISDGTTTGTVKVSELGLQEFRELTLVGNSLYFSAKDTLHGQELWKLNIQ